MSYTQVTDIKKMLRAPEGEGHLRGLATADTMRSAKSCLKKLGTYQEFDYVGADDGVKRPKPEADMFLEFQHKFNLKPEEIAVVGDTYNDVVLRQEQRRHSHRRLERRQQRGGFPGRGRTISWTLLRTCPGLLERMD